VLGNKCAGQHKLFILKRQLFKVIFGHGHQQYIFFVALSLSQDGGSKLSCSDRGGGARPLYALLEGALGPQVANQL
jgi:hypothetical protein